MLLPSTLVFDHPTARHLATRLRREVHKSNAWLARRPSERQASLVVRRCVSIVGESIGMPAGVVGMTAAWHAGTCSFDAIVQVPSDRWAVSASANTSSRVRRRHGGFVLAADRVDLIAFGLSSSNRAFLNGY